MAWLRNTAKDHTVAFCLVQRQINSCLAFGSA